MALGDLRVYEATSIVHGVTTINSKTHFGIRKSSTKMTDPGVAGSPGIAEERVTDRHLEVTIFAEDPLELDALVEAAVANLVLGHKGEAGAAKTITLKNVVFNDPIGDLGAVAKDAGGQVGRFSITGRAQWGAADTWALMVAHA